MSASLIWAAILAWQSSPQAADIVHEIVASGRVLEMVEAPELRVMPAKQIAPGAPPLLTFRYLEGSEKHRFNQLNLVIDDAGH